MAPSTFAMDYLNNVSISGETVSVPKKKEQNKKKQNLKIIPGTKKSELSLSRNSFIGIFSLVLFITILLIFAVFLNAKATSVKYSINSLTNDNTRLQNEINLVSTKIETANSMNYISKYAYEELGLETPKVSQYSLVYDDEIIDNLADTIKSKVFNN